MHSTQRVHLQTTDNDAFRGSNLRVIGISPDSVEEQDSFVKKQKLTVSSSNVQRPVAGSGPDGFIVPSVERLSWRVPSAVWRREGDVGSR